MDLQIPTTDACVLTGASSKQIVSVRVAYRIYKNEYRRYIRYHKYARNHSLSGGCSFSHEGARHHYSSRCTANQGDPPHRSFARARDGPYISEFGSPQVGWDTSARQASLRKQVTVRYVQKSVKGPRIEESAL